MTGLPPGYKLSLGRLQAGGSGVYWVRQRDPALLCAKFIDVLSQDKYLVYNIEAFEFMPGMVARQPDEGQEILTLNELIIKYEIRDKFDN